LPLYLLWLTQYTSTIAGTYLLYEEAGHAFLAGMKMDASACNLEPHAISNSTEKEDCYHGLEILLWTNMYNASTKVKN
jgi:hypothetical protein